MDVLENDFQLIEKQYSDLFRHMIGKCILITGATGMIASYLAKLLLYYADQYEIEVYLQCRNMKKAEKIYQNTANSPQLHLIQIDLDKEIDLDIPCDYIIHAASAAGMFYFKNFPVEVMMPNVVGTWNLLCYARQNGIRFLMLSSSTIYGEGGVEKEILSESDYGIVDPLLERSCYVEGKRCAEQLCASFSREYGVHAGIVRICHTYGPTLDILNDKRIIPRAIRQIINQKDIEIYDDPDSVTQCTYVGDVAAAILFVAAEGTTGEAYNACGDELLTMDQAISYMLNADPNIESKLVHLPVDSSYAFKKGSGINSLKLSNQKLKAMGWKVLFSNKEGFHRTIRSYLYPAAESLWQQEK